MSELSLTDRPSDDGTAVMLNFELSDASDIDHYEIYAASFSFDSVGDNGNGPDNPITILGRNPELPLLIEVLAYDASVIPNLPVTVAVVAVDSSGNAYRDNLVTATAISIDDGFDDVGAHLPDIEGISLEWIGNSILVTWDHSTNSEVRSYVIFISDKEFTYVDDSIMVGEVSAINSLLISPSLVSDLSNDSAWWIGVSAKGDNIYREKIDSVMIAPLGSEEGDGSGGGSPEKNPTDPFLGSLFASENLLAIGLAIISLILLILVLRTRGNAKSRDKDWELQEATWGIQSRSGWDDVVPTPKGSPPVEPPPGLGQSQQSSIYAAAQRIGGQVQPTLPAADPGMPGRDVYQKQMPVLNPEPREIPKTEIDTSFLDDLL